MPTETPQHRPDAEARRAEPRPTDSGIVDEIFKASRRAARNGRPRLAAQFDRWGRSELARTEAGSTGGAI